MTSPRVVQLLARFWRAAPAPPPAPVVVLPTRRWDEELKDAGVSAEDWVRRRLGRHALYVNVSDARIDQLRREHPALVQTTIDSALRVLRHEFNLLGSGPYTPVDPDRP